MSAEFPNSPIEIECRHCKAPAGEKCTTQVTRDEQWVRILRYFHSERWRDFSAKREERVKLDDWNNKYGGKSA
jgi:hypothetical protein